MNNPYTGQNFFGFFAVFVSRFISMISGKTSLESLATDEIQILVFSAIGISGALVGTFLVLKKMTMLANSLSHTILLGIIITYLLLPLSSFSLLVASLITAISTTFLMETFNTVMKLQKDASIGLVFSIFFALGIALVSCCSKNVHIGIDLVMGNADALKRSDLTDVFVILGINIVLFLLFFRGFKITTFDPQLAKSVGFSNTFFNYILMMQTSATSVGGFKAVGVLMVVSFFVTPTLTARLLTHNLHRLIWMSVLISLFVSFVGVALSRHCLSVYGIGLSTGGIVVSLLGITFLVTAICATLYGQKNLKIGRIHDKIGRITQK